MINPAKLFKLKSAWDTFSKNHPKFPKFLEAMHKSGMEEGSLIEINVTTPDGKTICSNIKITQSDKELFAELSELFR